MGIYIHIPFCNSICSYCDFCKFLYNKKWVDNYLNVLQKEINKNYKNELVRTIYIGGGTPSSLSIEQLNKLFEIIKILKKEKVIEFTFECNIEDINEPKLELLKNNGVNRISIGVESFNDKYLKFLGRNYKSKDIMNRIDLAKKYFDNINIDLIYALPNQTLEELESDIDKFLSLDINHISTYSLIIEPNTKLYINKTKNINDEKDFEMYNLICNKLKSKGYNHYEISNFSKESFESKHNLLYWNNLEYYGFGLGSGGYIGNIRYQNTRSFNNYINGKYMLERNEIDIDEKISNEFILGLRKIKGINKLEFMNKYNKDIYSIECVKKLVKENKLIDDGKNIFINPKYIYISNDILVEFI